MREMHFLEILTKNSEIFRPYFCYCSCSQFKLTAERLIRMFSHVIYSSQEEERDMWNKETSTFMMFENVLDKCEDGDVDCSLSDILAFVTGLSMIYDNTYLKVWPQRGPAYCIHLPSDVADTNLLRQ
eukprot:m.62356 g.62356  ORF g.62356 m.62356 type:complete len:127 (+) comp35059_c0_seq3:1445-1825(+)